ncbi:MAG: hypothetical protein KGM98_02360, partial [Bacteroidota bacterium]|nr:hypothetical protein [Bacteroidota bacterium]
MRHRIFIFFLLFIFIAIGIGVNAQQPPATTPSLNNSLIPPSPEAASIAKYGILPVTLYEGMPNVSIPILNIQSTKLSLPISLGYNYNGYRPGEVAGSVGLGWSLEAGGVITRVVRGMVDEDPALLYPWTGYAGITDLTGNMDFMDALGNTKIADGEPDLYIFHFNGHSGKFIMLGNRAYLFPRQNLKIIKSDLGFTITAEDGTIYNFFIKETTTPKAQYHLPGSYTSAWDISNIISADRSDTISYQYTTYYGPQSTEGYSETYQRNGKGFNCGSNSGCDVWSINYSPVNYINMMRLREIQFKNGNIQFIPEGQGRLDLAGDTALGEIDINNSTEIIKKIKLSHSYFTGSVSNQASGPSQLRLDSLKIYGFYATSVTDTAILAQQAPFEAYSFQYANETTGKFPRYTRGIDYWGYYNGADNNEMLFDASITPYQPIYTPATRNTDETKAVNGALTQITYPTGGYTKLTWEGNLVDYNINSSGADSYCSLNNVASAVATYTGTGDTIRATGSFEVDSCPDTYGNIAPVKVEFGQKVASYNNVKDLYTILHINSLKTGQQWWPPSPSGFALGYDTDYVTTLQLPPGIYTYSVICENSSGGNNPISTFANISNITHY